jgi:prepilin peptidase CpaA
MQRRCLLEVFAFTMTLHPQAIALTAFGVVMITAAFEDFRRLVIPNLLPIAVCALWPVYFYFSDAPSFYGALAAIGCAAAVFVGGAAVFFYDSRLFGGGDVKLLGAVTLWAGPARTPDLLMLTALIGGALAVFLLIPGGARIADYARAMLGQPAVDVGHGRKMKMPYGVAIAGAALIVVLSPQPG